MIRFILVRHGQTEWNRVERYRGRADIPLNEVGIAQAQAVAERLAGVPIAAVYSSPLSRAFETARAIAEKHGHDVETTDALIDIDFGDWQGLTPKEVSEKYPDLHSDWLHHPERVKMPGGESLDDVRARVLDFVKELSFPRQKEDRGKDLAKRFENQTVVLVSHRVVCKVLLCAVLELDNSRFWQIEQDNVAINTFEWDQRQGFVVHSINDTCHLKGLEGQPTAF